MSDQPLRQAVVAAAEKEAWASGRPTAQDRAIGIAAARTALEDLRRRTMVRPFYVTAADIDALLAQLTPAGEDKTK